MRKYEQEIWISSQYLKKPLIKFMSFFLNLKKKRSFKERPYKGYLRYMLCPHNVFTGDIASKSSIFMSENVFSSNHLW